MKIEKRGKTVDITLENDLVDDYSATFIKNMKELTGTDHKRFNIDFKGVTYLDSAALSKLIVYCDKSDLEFSLKNVSIPVKNIFDIIKLDKRVLFE
jgi:anti-anti-sigma regulatory factor